MFSLFFFLFVFTYVIHSCTRVDHTMESITDSKKDPEKAKMPKKRKMKTKFKAKKTKKGKQSESKEDKESTSSRPMEEKDSMSQFCGFIQQLSVSDPLFGPESNAGLQSRALYHSMILNRGERGAFVFEFNSWANLESEVRADHLVRDKLEWATFTRLDANIRERSDGESSLNQTLSDEDRRRIENYDILTEYCVIFISPVVCAADDVDANNPSQHIEVMIGRRWERDDAEVDGYIVRHLMQCKACYPSHQPEKILKSFCTLSPAKREKVQQSVEPCSTCGITFFCRDAKDPTHERVRKEHKEWCKTHLDFISEELKKTHTSNKTETEIRKEASVQMHRLVLEPKMVHIGRPMRSGDGWDEDGTHIVIVDSKSVERLIAIEFLVMHTDKQTRDKFVQWENLEYRFDDLPKLVQTKHVENLTCFLDSSNGLL